MTSDGAVAVGIVGLGRIGHTNGVAGGGDPLAHSEAYARIPGADIRLGIDPSAEARRAFAARWPAAAVFADARDVPPATRLEVVSVCTPTADRHHVLDAVLAWRPKVAVLEKPLAATAADAEAVLAACAASGCAVIVNYVRRWTPMLRALKSAVAEDGPLGGLAGAAIRFSGGLVHNGTHWLDLLRAVAGEPAVSRLPFGRREDADPAEGLALRWSSGAEAILVPVVGTRFAIGEGELWGPRGIVRFVDAGRTVTVQTARESPTWPGFHELGPAQVLCEDGLRGHLLGPLTEAIALARHGGTPTCGGQDGLRALQLVEAARAGAAKSMED